MLHIIAIMLLGVILGYKFRDSSVIHKTEYTISLTIIALLFILGLSIGSNPQIVNNLSSFGSQAALLALFGLGGSVLASAIVYRMLYGKGGKDER